jgi:uncharacterized membrane protein
MAEESGPVWIVASFLVWMTLFRPSVKRAEEKKDRSIFLSLAINRSVPDFPDFHPIVDIRIILKI